MPISTVLYMSKDPNSGEVISFRPLWKVRRIEVRLRESALEPIVILVTSPLSIASPVAWLKKCLGTCHSNWWKSVELIDVSLKERSSARIGILWGVKDFATVSSLIRGYSKIVKRFSISSDTGVMSANLFCISLIFFLRSVRIFWIRCVNFSISLA